jgi:hypothetical protein
MITDKNKEISKLKMDVESLSSKAYERDKFDNKNRELITK